LNKVHVVVAEMRGGQALHHHFDRRGPVWALSDGREVRPDIAELVIIHPGVVGVGDALFHDAPGQTYRWAEKPHD
jgi:hypothetical protein